MPERPVVLPPAKAGLPLTQEFLSQMMGVQRTSVTGVATRMQSEGLISYRRGRVQILDIDLVQKRSCECPASARTLCGNVWNP
jgi:hypothetical protein